MPYAKSKKLYPTRRSRSRRTSYKKSPRRTIARKSRRRSRSMRANNKKSLRRTPTRKSRSRRTSYKKSPRRTVARRRRSRSMRFNNKKSPNQTTTKKINSITIYTQDGCGACESAKALLEEYRKKEKKEKGFIIYQKRQDHEELVTELTKDKLAPGTYDYVPVIIIDDKFIGGYTELQEILKQI